MKLEKILERHAEQILGVAMRSAFKTPPGADYIVDNPLQTLARRLAASGLEEAQWRQVGEQLLRGGLGSREDLEGSGKDSAGETPAAESLAAWLNRQMSRKKETLDPWRTPVSDDLLADFREPEEEGNKAEGTVPLGVLLWTCLEHWTRAIANELRSEVAEHAPTTEEVKAAELLESRLPLLLWQQLDKLLRWAMIERADEENAMAAEKKEDHDGRDQ
jgi:hypothetical protein